MQGIGKIIIKFTQWILFALFMLMAIFHSYVWIDDVSNIPFGVQLATLIFYLIFGAAFFLKAKGGKSGIFRGAVGLIILLLSATPIWFDFSFFEIPSPDAMGSLIVGIVLALIGAVITVWSYRVFESSNKRL